MARWGSRALDTAIVSGLVLSFVFAARPRGHSLAPRIGLPFALLAGWRLFATDHRWPFATQVSPASANSTLVSIVAHEIRAPLAAIRGAVALLDEHALTLENDRRSELLRVAFDASKQLGLLVDDLLLISRIAGGRLAVERGPVDIVSVVRDAASAEVAQEITVVEQEEHPKCQRRPPLRIRQVVGNLLSNAVANATASSLVLASITREERDVRVTVYNEGRGILPEEQSRSVPTLCRANRTAHRFDRIRLVHRKRTRRSHGRQNWIRYATRL